MKPALDVPDDYDKASFLKAYNEQGYVIVKGDFDFNLLDKLRVAMMDCIEAERKNIGQPNCDYRDYGFLLCAPYYLDKYPFLLEVFNNQKYLKYIEWILDKWYIMHLYSCNCLMPKNGKNKAGEIHIDTPRILPNRYHTFVATMINMDDYTEQNGATWILPSSFQQQEKPDEKFFYENAIQLVVPKGTMCFFNARVWHATGINNTDTWRTCLLIAFCKPWMKQRVDIPKFIHHIDKKLIPENFKQLLGFQSQPPTSFDEFYGPIENRTYTQPFV